jgi:DNA-binding transcriptional ArsR family regulator/uncharacterized protein YndB with AHSA1/START domain
MASEELRLPLVELEGATAPLWRALADPTRRRVLDLLRERPRITGEIASHFKISRIAVMRHLDVLSEAGLVTSRKRGRERWYYLNLVPLQRIHERWFSEPASGWASGLLRLQGRVEARGREMDSSQPAIDVALDVEIAGTPAEVFAALTEDPGGWWGHPFVRAQAIGLTLDARLGGLFAEQWEGGGGELIATVTALAEDRHLRMTGQFHLGIGVGTVTFDLAPTATGTQLQFTYRAIGVVDAELVDQMSRGWTELVAARLKALVETGTRLGVAADPPPTDIRSKRKGAGGGS